MEASKDASIRCNILSEWQLLENELTCGYCKQLYAEPKTISCLHTFCSRCVESATNTDTGDFTCALCSMTFPKEKIVEFPVNSALSSLVTITNKRKALGKIKGFGEGWDSTKLAMSTCNQCEEGVPASRWCLVCNDPELCEKCYESHCRLKIFRTHRVVLLEDFIQNPSVVLNCSSLLDYCEEHTSRTLDFYCKNCCKFVCPECTCCCHMSLSNSACRTQQVHIVKVADSVCEVERIKLKEMNKELKLALNKVNLTVQDNKSAENMFYKSIAREVAWVHETFQEIRNIVDRHEQDILLDLAMLKSTQTQLFTTQHCKLNSLEKELSSCMRFTSGVLCPFRSKELFVYSEWIAEKITELTNRSIDPLCKVFDNDLMIEHDSFSIDDLDRNLASMHQAFHHPYIPKCSVNVMNDSLAFVKVEVTLKDKYNHPVLYQLAHLGIEGNREMYFFSKVDWECTGKGTYVVSYVPYEKKHHTLSITWKDNVLFELNIAGHLFHYPVIAPYCSIKTYNKKPLRRDMKAPKFLTSLSNNTIISDPKDSRLIILHGNNYRCVVTNGNYPYFTPSGTTIDPYGHLYVANPAKNCIMKFKKDGSYLWCNNSSSQFGESGTKNGQFLCPQGIVISKCGLMYICDQGNSRIQVYYIPEYGEEQFRYAYGQSNNLFNQPTDVALNTNEDRLFITDTGNHRVQIFTLNNPFVAVLMYVSFIQHPSMHCPFGVCCTVDGELLVSAEDFVIVFKENGTFVFGIDFKDKGPTGIAVNQQGKLVVSLTLDRRVVFYS